MDLTARAADLQTEAYAVLRRLELEAAFPTFGPAQVVGSALSGLMAWRDLDVVFIAPSATAEQVLAGLAQIAKAGGLLEVDFRDERGDRRPTPSPTDERFYAVLRYEGATAVWKVDLTFWLHPIARPHVADADRLKAATPEQKLAILRLKDEHPGYPDEVGGTDIYSAVLDHGVRSTDELTAHLAK